MFGNGVIISLCDLTGNMVAPWVEAGYHAILVDPQHGEGIHTEGKITKVGYTIDADQTWNVLRGVITRVSFVAGFPPCTDVAVSGAAWWASKREADPYFQAKAAIVAEQCRTFGQASGAPWFFENPVSAFSKIFGPPSHTFHPFEYGGYLPENDNHPQWPEYIKPRDAYPKKTCLWTGGGFEMPERRAVHVEPGYSDQHKKLGGKSDRTKNIRSATPRGFARAVFEANAPHLRAENDNQKQACDQAKSLKVNPQ